MSISSPPTFSVDPAAAVSPTTVRLPTTPRDVVLALDIGSSSVRCSAYYDAELNDDDDDDGSEQRLLECLCVASRSFQAVQPNTGGIRIQALLQTVDVCIDECLDGLRRLSAAAAATFATASTLQEEGDHKDPDSDPPCRHYQVIAVGISTFVMNLIGVDANGRCLGDDDDNATLSYACHTDAVVKKVATIRAELGPDACQSIYQRTGAPIHAATALAQLRVLYDHVPPATCRSVVAQWTTLSSLLISQWTSSPNEHQHQQQLLLPISYSEASWTGLMNVTTCEYDDELLSLLPEECINALPKLVDFDELDIPAGISPQSRYYSKWPELRDAKWYLGLGDGACANLGSQCTVPHRIACTVGTSAAARIVVKLPLQDTCATRTAITIPAGLFCYRINRHYCLLGGALTDGGSVVEWLSQLLNMPPTSEAFRSCMLQVEEMVQDDLNAAHSPKVSLVTLPFLSGERSTGFRSGATGAILGLTRETTPAHLFKASLEGVTLRIAAIVSLIQSASASLTSCSADGLLRETKIFASGKALEANGLWRQMISDCTGLPVIFDEDTQEATSRGVVYMVMGAWNRHNSATVRTRSSSARCPSAVVGLEVIVPSPHECRPRPGACAYWKRAAAAQDDFMTAVFPIDGMIEDD